MLWLWGHFFMHFIFRFSLRSQLALFLPSPMFIFGFICFRLFHYFLPHKIVAPFVWPSYLSILFLSDVFVSCTSL